MRKQQDFTASHTETDTYSAESAASSHPHPTRSSAKPTRRRTLRLCALAVCSSYETLFFRWIDKCDLASRRLYGLHECISHCLHIRSLQGMQPMSSLTPPFCNPHPPSTTNPTVKFASTVTVTTPAPRVQVCAAADVDRAAVDTTHTAATQ